MEKTSRRNKQNHVEIRAKTVPIPALPIGRFTNQYCQFSTAFGPGVVFEIKTRSYYIVPHHRANTAHFTFFWSVNALELEKQDIALEHLAEIPTAKSSLFRHIVVAGDRKSTRLNSSHLTASRMPSSA